MFSEDPAYAQFLELLADLLLAGPRQESAPGLRPEWLGQPAPAAKATPDGTDPAHQARP